MGRRCATYPLRVFRFETDIHSISGCSSSCIRGRRLEPLAATCTIDAQHCTVYVFRRFRLFYESFDSHGRPNSQVLLWPASDSETYMLQT